RRQKVRHCFSNVAEPSRALALSSARAAMHATDGPRSATGFTLQLMAADAGACVRYEARPQHVLFMPRALAANAGAVGCNKSIAG
ncbi:hypothetical protein V5799_034392, partial [Amblyomma americanum]